MNKVKAFFKSEYFHAVIISTGLLIVCMLVGSMLDQPLLYLLPILPAQTVIFAVFFSIVPLSFIEALPPTAGFWLFLFGLVVIVLGTVLLWALPIWWVMRTLRKRKAAPADKQENV